MTDLLHSVRQRYQTGMNFHNLFTLSHRTKRKPARPKLDTTDLERGILRSVNSDMTRFAEQWKQQSLRTEKQRSDAEKRYKRQSDLVLAGINIQIKRLRRELAALKAWENERLEEENSTKETITSLAGRSAKRLLEEHEDISNIKMHAEISYITKKTVRSAMRQMQEEQEYERRRGRGG